MFQGLKRQWQINGNYVWILGSAYLIFATNDRWFQQMRFAIARSPFYYSKPMIEVEGGHPAMERKWAFISGPVRP